MSQSCLITALLTSKTSRPLPSRKSGSCATHTYLRPRAHYRNKGTGRGRGGTLACLLNFDSWSVVDDYEVRTRRMQSTSSTSFPRGMIWKHRDLEPFGKEGKCGLFSCLEDDYEKDVFCVRYI
ncbi:hypothetical protein TNCT_473861 [Trichonephila clavata]|uniref:Uncharacterized protein n=1 Tax=Trichonephila clavata TaxID=2740835 RepID=A0A8X6GG17_TRICU|nr:hypothetical protein TNCT_473861 [Trichonephila clavata]